MGAALAYNTSQREMRDFSLKVGKVDCEYGRTLKVMARSSLEAGLIIVERELIPAGYVVHSLIDPARPMGDKNG